MSTAQIHVELHLSPSALFTREGWGRKVKKAGGTYSAARGDVTARYVTVPFKSIDLICDLVERFGNYRRAYGHKMTFVLRGPGVWRARSNVGHLAEKHNAEDRVAEVIEAQIKIAKGEADAIRERIRQEKQAEDDRREAERRERAAPWVGIRAALVEGCNALTKDGTTWTAEAVDLFHAVRDLDEEIRKMGILDLVKKS
jgi:hypothetical protein